MPKSPKNDPIVRLRSISGNYKWTELVKLLRQLGYLKIEREGSRVAFHHPEKNLLLNVHKPHPGNNVKKYAQRKVIKHLEDSGLI
ncbi:MAG: type II toxin-antitoxin system HicA family toxin [Bacteroidales bacterium]|nr:type II toxin-antitoxin system HicA family toxin [Bacteroidales bacterium]